MRFYGMFAAKPALWVGGQGARDLSTQVLKNLGVTLVFIWLGCVIYVVLEQIAGILTFREFAIDPVRRIHIITIYYWLPWLLLAPLVALMSRRFPIRPENWLLPLTAHLGLLVLASLCHGLVIGYVYHYSHYLTPYMATFEPWQHSGHFLFGDYMFLFDVVFYSVIAASLNIGNFLQIVRQQELDASRLNQNLAELRFQTLRMQINPHFLFNALNAIAVLVVKKETDRAAEMIRRLSQLFRRSLDKSRDHWVPLEEELDTTRQYLAIACLRFGERLSVTEHCDPGICDVSVPSMLLQPLVENAVTHGLAERIGDCELRIDCRRSGERLRIEISDNGVGGRYYADPEFKEGVGLTNVRARLRQMYGDDHAFELVGEPGRGTRAAVEIPLRPAPRLRIAV